MKFQITLANILLLIAVVAISIAVWMQRNRNLWYANQLLDLQDTARELVVEDSSKLHAVASQREWIGERKWLVHIPTNRKIQLSLATENISYPNAVHTPEESVSLSAGRHVIELHQTEIEPDMSLIEILVDNQVLISVKKDKTWRPIKTIPKSAQDVRGCKSFELDQNVRLAQTKFYKLGVPYRPTDATNGILLWISSENSTHTQ